MIFSTPIFLLFFIFVFLIYWYLLPLVFKDRGLHSGRHLFLLFMSYIFYTYSVWQYGLLIAISTLIDYIAGLVIGHAHQKENRRKLKKAALAISLVMNLGILGYFKYTNFFIDNFIEFLIRIGAAEYSTEGRRMMLLHLILPVGISFFTFQSMSYTIDVYRKIIPVEKNFIRFALFISFFPQLVAGPIVTAKEFLPQLNIIPKFKMDDMCMAMRFFMLGYVKKVVLADNMAPIVDQIYNHPEAFGPKAHWLGAMAFWVQVYGDFSGYSDMAIGTALFLGFKLPENFRIPYLSRSVTEHWQRWHMSLIRWNRDYIYIPLGGSQVSFWRHKYNIFITMFLAGVWHGANWTFVIWGSIHGFVLVAESLWRDFRSRWLQKKYTSVEYQQYKSSRKEIIKSGSWFQKKKLLNPLFFLFTSFITIYFGTMFRSNNINDAILILSNMLGYVDPDIYTFTGHIKPGTFSSISNSMLYRVVYSTLAIYIGSIIGWQIFEKNKFHWKIPAWLEFVLLPVVVLLSIQLGFTGIQAFIYFQF